MNGDDYYYGDNAAGELVTTIGRIVAGRKAADKALSDLRQGGDFDTNPNGRSIYALEPLTEDNLDDLSDYYRAEVTRTFGI